MHIFTCILTDLMETVLGYMNFLSFDFFDLPRSLLNTVHTYTKFHVRVSKQTYSMTRLDWGIACSTSL